MALDAHFHTDKGLISLQKVESNFNKVFAKIYGWKDKFHFRGVIGDGRKDKWTFWVGMDFLGWGRNFVRDGQTS